MNIRFLSKKPQNEDLVNVMSLWNDGTVMYYVGFLNGLGITMEKLEKWLLWAINKPYRCHYSIYGEGIGYCGETFYNIDTNEHTGALDIKLLPEAQGKGIAKIALTYAINQAFEIGKAERLYVEPHHENTKAILLYEKIGFVMKPRPAHLEE